MVLSRLIFGTFRGYPSKSNLIRAPVQESFSINSLYPNCSNGFKPIRTPRTRLYPNWSKPSSSESSICGFSPPIQSPFLNGAKRLYHVGGNQASDPRQTKSKWPIKTLLFSIYILVNVTPEVYLHEDLENVPFTNRTHLVRMSAESEKQMGQVMFRRALLDDYGKKVLPSDHPDSIKVQGIAKNIIEALPRALETQTGATRHLEGLRWEVMVADDAEEIAGSAPGGKIMVFTRVLRRASSDDEIAFLIGLQVAHMVARHQAESFSKFYWLDSIDRYVHNYLPSWIGVMLAQILMLPLEFRIQIEADYIGQLLMAYAGYDPRMARGILYKVGSWYAFDFYLRDKLLNRAKVMQEAIEIYRETIAMQHDKITDGQNVFTSPC